MPDTRRHHQADNHQIGGGSYLARRVARSASKTKDVQDGRDARERLPVRRARSSRMLAASARTAGAERNHAHQCTPDAIGDAARIAIMNNRPAPCPGPKTNSEATKAGTPTRIVTAAVVTGRSRNNIGNRQTATTAPYTGHSARHATISPRTNPPSCPSATPQVTPPSPDRRRRRSHPTGSGRCCG